MINNASSDTVLMSTDTTLFALPFIGGVVLAVPSPCRVPQNNRIRIILYATMLSGTTLGEVGKG